MYIYIIYKDWPVLKHGHIHSANQNPVFLYSIFHLLF